ncbi:hypothetical protein BpHYR1_039142 [Brachionus plicatilis]|uniref:Uncharacterized protein n=1 Tax=Brachionus plicatilis TaxID=10195 RepID=A0A3M7PMW7_BRAPC|nr:hypothetical protein BpHYR1_039142 [Brachionus plicatilis]
MALRSRAQSTKRLNTRLEGFLAQKLGAENVEYYDQESCIEENKKNVFLNKFMFKLLLVCDDRFYITDNPPTNLDNFVLFEDVIDFKTVKI